MLNLRFQDEFKIIIFILTIELGEFRINSVSLISTWCLLKHNGTIGLKSINQSKSFILYNSILKIYKF